MLPKTPKSQFYVFQIKLQSVVVCSWLDEEKKDIVLLILIEKNLINILIKLKPKAVYN
jgi:hypothetical protein